MGVCICKSKTLSKEVIEPVQVKPRPTHKPKRSISQTYEADSLKASSYEFSGRAFSRRSTRSSSMGLPSLNSLAIWGLEIEARQMCFDEKRIFTSGADVSTAALIARGLAFSCKKGKKEDSHNQDNFHIFSDSNTLLLAVFDGHGTHGHDISSFAAASLPKSVTAGLKIGKQPRKALSEAFKKTHEDLKRYKNICCEASGSTATVVLTQGDKLYTGHVGDSTAVIGRAHDEGHKAIKLTEDHKPDLPKESKRIKEAGGTVRRTSMKAPYRVYKIGEELPGLAMSRALGDFDAQRVGVSHSATLKEYTLSPADEFVVLASDGLWEFVTHQEVVDIVSKAGRARARFAVEALSRLALDCWLTHGRTVDDITIVLAYLSS